MADEDKVTHLYITYENGYAEVEIERDGVRRKHDAKYRNVDNEDAHDFCADVANKVEKEIGCNAQWSMVKKSGSKKPWSTAKILVVVFVSIFGALGIIFAGMVAYLVINPSYMNAKSQTNQASTAATDARNKSDASVNNSAPTSGGDSKLTEEQKRMLEEVKLIEPVEIHDESNSSYNVYVGTLQNKSDKTHYFIKVRGEFKDAQDNTIDTDWTYACGSEGLRPGESTKFTLSVTRDDRITGISCYTIDFS